MNYLKKLYTINLIAFSGYGVFGYFLYLLIKLLFERHINMLYSIIGLNVNTYINLYTYRKYIIIPILIEIFLNFALHKFLKRSIDLYIENSKYDFSFRLGLMLFLTPIMIFLLFIIFFVLSFFLQIVPVLAELLILMEKYSAINYMILFLYYYYCFKLLVKYVFFRK